MKSRTIEWQPLAIVILCSMLIFLFLLVRNVGLYPAVFSDEYTYSRFARLTTINESTIPCYVYLKVYSVTNLCRDGFLGCARILNAVFFVSAAPFVYLICRQVASKRHAVMISILTILGPINSYTVYFMPESMYFLSFWIFIWTFLKLNINTTPPWFWIVSGACFGFSTLVKPHSLFLIPALLIYCFFLLFFERVISFQQGLVRICTFALCASLFKILVSYAMAGSSGLTLFGPLYSSIAKSAGNDSNRLAGLVMPATVSIFGHLSALAVMYGLPVAIMLSSVVKFCCERTIGLNQKVAILSFLILGNLICVVALFTASVSDASPYESIYRLHMRYYNFAIPLLYIVAAGSIKACEGKVNVLVRLACGIVVVVFAAYGIYTNLHPYQPSFVDSPELKSLWTLPWAFKAIGAGLVFILAWWMLSEKFRMEFYLMFILPFVVLFSLAINTLEIRGRLYPDKFDRAGMLARQIIPKEDLSKTIVIGKEAFGMPKVMFYLDDPNVLAHWIKDERSQETVDVSADMRWVIRLCDNEISGPHVLFVEKSDFAIFHIETK